MKNLKDIVMDDYNLKIMCATRKKARCVQDLSQAHDIPIAMCYRRVNELEQAGLILFKEKRTNQNGRQVKHYLSLTKRTLTFCENGYLEIHIHLTNGDVRHEKLKLEDLT